MSSAANKTRQRRRKAPPSPPGNPRVAVHAPPLSDASAMATQAKKLIAAAEAHPSVFVTPPYLPPLKAGVVVLDASITAAEGGSDADQAALFTDTKKVRGLINQHASWVQGGANALSSEDAASFIVTAGFEVAKKAQRAARTAPELKNVAPDVVRFLLPRMPGAVMWFSEVSTDGGKTFAHGVDTETQKGDITGLPSKQDVTVRLRAFVRKSGYTPWTTLTIFVT